MAPSEDRAPPLLSAPQDGIPGSGPSQLRAPFWQLLPGWLGRSGVGGALTQRCRGAGLKPGPLTREQEPQLPAEAFGDALQHQLPRSGRAVHAHASPVLEEVNVPRLLFHLLLGLGEKQAGPGRVRWARLHLQCTATRAQARRPRHHPGRQRNEPPCGDLESGVTGPAPGSGRVPLDSALRGPEDMKWRAGARPSPGLLESMPWPYPLGPQVLHGRVSLEEFKQPLGCGRRLLRTGALAEGCAGTGRLIGRLWRDCGALKNTTQDGKHPVSELPRPGSLMCGQSAV